VKRLEHHDIECRLQFFEHGTERSAHNAGTNEDDVRIFIHSPTSFGATSVRSAVGMGTDYRVIAFAMTSQLKVVSVCERMTHGDRAPVETYVDSISSPSKFSIF
jgi:hypothetical protein